MNIIKRILCFVLTLSITLSNQVIFAEVSSDDTDAKTEVPPLITDNLVSEQDPDSIDGEDIYNPDTKVSVIVELEDDALMEYIDHESIQEYLGTSNAKVVETRLQTRQAEVVAQMEALLGAENVKVENKYTVVMNGFSVETAYKNLEKIESMEHVKRTFVGTTYEAVKPTMADSNHQIKAPQAWETMGYRGEGLVVGVLDTGLDTTHEAFQAHSLDAAKIKMSVQDVAKIYQDVSLTAEQTTEGLTAAQTYVNDKVPFAYDYADADSSVVPEDAVIAERMGHGTHVAGTIAGNTQTFKGVAPNAQLMIFKVFNDNNLSTNDSTIIAALDDAMKLGVDVINMSLGSDAGFTQIGQSMIGDIYNRVSEANIILNVAAGNAHSSASNNNWGKNLTLAEDPDHGLVASPSTYASSLSIASVDNAVVDTLSIKLGNHQLAYTPTKKRFTALGTDTFDYVMISGVGNLSDYEAMIADGVDVQSMAGKVFVVPRGAITFVEKVNNAARYGAVGVLVYNNVEGSLTHMNSDNMTLPAGFLSLQDGELLKHHEPKSLQMLDVGVSSLAATQDAVLSDFSSMGTTNDLRIKPELSAPGGDIYSTFPTQSQIAYITMSGTSMASPHAAGGSAILKQHLTQAFPQLTPKALAERVSQLLMSTASPAMGVNGYQPVRKQGAGLFNLEAAIKSPAYLWVDQNKDGTQRPKLELGDDKDKTGTYSMKFNVSNTSATPLTYAIETHATIPEVETITRGTQGETQLLMKDTNASVAIHVDGPSLITVNPNQTYTVELTVNLDEQTKQTLNDNFKNGSYVEGFVQLKPQADTGEAVKLSLPFLAFYGDWEQAPIFDHGIWYDDASMASNFKSVVSSKGRALGRNALNLGRHSINPEMMTLSPNGDEVSDGITKISLGLLRNVKTLDYKVTHDATGQIMHYFKSENVKKTHFNPYLGMQLPSTVFDPAKPWLATDLLGNTAPDGRYTYTIAADNGYRDGVDDILSFSVLVDTQAPTIDAATIAYVKEADKVSLKFQAVDENYLVLTSAVPMEAGKADWQHPLQQIYTPNEGVNSHDMKFDVTDLAGQKINVGLFDSGMNYRTYELLIPHMNGN